MQINIRINVVYIMEKLAKRSTTFVWFSRVFELQRKNSSKSNALLSTYSTFIVVSIHWPCHCTYAVVHFVRVFCSFEWKWICAGFFIVILNLYCVWPKPGGLGCHWYIICFDVFMFNESYIGLYWWDCSLKLLKLSMHNHLIMSALYSLFELYTNTTYQNFEIRGTT